jgi:adenylate cyclase
VTALGVDPVLDELVRSELIDQVGFTPKIEYAFRHPLIRFVAYESQLKSDRDELHRRLAALIEQHDPESTDENAALIAEHHKAAGNLRAAFDWYMRAGTWLTHRDLAAARASWRHARDVADRLPDTDADREAMRIHPRTLLCASAWLTGGTMADTGFDELRDLATAAGDKVSLAMAMAGWLPALIVHARFDEASRLASELEDLLDSIGDPTLILGLLYGAMPAKMQRAELSETIRIAQRTIELADGDAVKGNLIIGSPLTGAMMLRGCARCLLGDPDWKTDVDQALRMVRAFEPSLRAIMLLFKYNLIPLGIWLPDAASVQETTEMLEIAERSGDDLTLACARYIHGVAIVTCDAARRDEAFVLLAAAREAALQERFTMGAATLVNLFVANEKLRTGDPDGAIELLRPSVEEQYARPEQVIVGATATALVKALLRRGRAADLVEAQAAIDRLAALPIEPGFVVHDLWLLSMRAAMAQAQGDDVAYRDHRDRYRAMANSLGFEGHIAWAEAME